MLAFGSSIHLLLESLPRPTPLMKIFAFPFTFAVSRFCFPKSRHIGFGPWLTNSWRWPWWFFPCKWPEVWTGWSTGCAALLTQPQFRGFFCLWTLSRPNCLWSQRACCQSPRHCATWNFNQSVHGFSTTWPVPRRQILLATSCFGSCKEF